MPKVHVYICRICYGLQIDTHGYMNHSLNLSITRFGEVVGTGVDFGPNLIPRAIFKKSSFWYGEKMGWGQDCFGPTW